MEEGLAWWLQYLRIFALNSPFGMPVKFTIGVTAHDGEHVARHWRQEPYDVVDAYGIPCRQVQTEDKLIAVEWRIEKPDPNRAAGPSTWGGGMPARKTAG